MEALSDPLIVPRHLRRVEQWVLARADRRHIVEQRRRNYAELGKSLVPQSDLFALFPELPRGAAPYVFPIWSANPEEVYAYLRSQRLPVLRWDRYWPGADDSPDDIGRNWGHHVLQVLCHQDLTIGDMRIIADVLNERAAARVRLASGFRYVDR